MIYAGIGSRQTPNDILELMYTIGATLAGYGWTLRSGHAGGADLAFENGAKSANGDMEIYLPWSGFNGASPDGKHYFVGNHPQAKEVASRFHPAWDRCSEGAKTMHSRNVYQVTGINLDKAADCVVCWTPNASGSGGTGQALRIAEHLEIPIFDLANPHASDELSDFVSTHLK